MVASARVVANLAAMHAPEQTASASFTAAWNKKLVELDNLWRHLLGVPRGYVVRRVPKIVRDLAEVVYDQHADAIAPLHDALLDHGLTELAEHFHDPRIWHPKDCWALDLLRRPDSSSGERLFSEFGCGRSLPQLVGVDFSPPRLVPTSFEGPEQDEQPV